MVLRHTGVRPIRWVVALVAALILLPIAMASAQTPDCDSPATLEQGRLQHLNLREGFAVIASEGQYHAFQVASGTQFLGKDGEPASPEQFQPGDSVKAIYCPVDTNEPLLANDGALTLLPSGVLRSLQLLDTADKVVASGPITEMGPTIALYNGWIRVEGLQFILAPETRIVDADGSPIPPGALAIGDMVRVEGTYLTNENETSNTERPLIATFVKRFSQDPHLTFVVGEIESTDPESRCFELIVQHALNEGLFANHPVRVCVPGEAPIRNTDGEDLDFDDLSAGDRVKVVFDPRLDAASIIAVEVIVLDRPNHVIEVEGRITAIALLDSTNEGGIVQVGRVALLVTGETEIKAADGSVRTFDDLAVGQYIKARAVPRSATSTLLALSIMIQEPPPAGDIRGIIVEVLSEERCFLVANEPLHPDNTSIALPLLMKVCVTNATILRTESGEHLEFEDFTRGDRVHVIPPDSTQILDDNHTIIASEIVRLDDPVPPVVLLGNVFEVYPDRHCFQMNNELSPLAVMWDVCVTNTTRIRFQNGEPADFDGIEPATRVKVFAEHGGTPAGMTALEVIILREFPRPVAVIGKIQRIEPAPNSTDRGIVVVDHTPFLVTSETQLTGDDGEPIRFEALEVEQLVRAWGHPTSGSELIRAEEITLLPDVHPVPVRFRGVIESIDLRTGQLVVRGTLVQTGDHTRILGEDNEPLELADLAVGDYVLVGGFRTRDNTVRAALIQLLPDPADDDTVKFRGVISEIDVEGAALIIAGRPVIVTDQTSIFGIDGEPIRLSDLRVGMIAGVHGVPLRAIERPVPIEAIRIKVLAPGCVDVRFHGVIDEIADEGWNVSGRRVRIDEDTRFSSSNGDRLTADDFEPGNRVRVHACASRETAPLARHIVRVDAPVSDDTLLCEPNIAFGGAVTGVDPDQQVLHVEGRPVQVAPYTLIHRENDGRITLADIEEGELAFVRAQRTSENRMPIACVIRVGDQEPPRPLDHRVVGMIREIDSGAQTLLVRDRVILVTADTRIVSRRGEALTFDDLQVEQMIDAVGRLDADAVLVAARIRVQEENILPRPIRPVVGLLTSIDLPDSITIGSKTVLVTEDTVYTGLHDEPIDSGVLLPGDAVMAVVAPAERPATEREMPQPVALKVRLLAALIEAIDGDSQTIIVAGGRVSVTDQTTIREARTGEELSFDDLAVGDLVRVRLAPLDVEPPVASLIVRAATPSFSDRIDTMGEVVSGFHRGRPTITSTNPANSFGFISLPFDMASAEPNTLYDIRMTVSTDVADPATVPAARIRANMANYEKGATLVINSADSFSHVPTPAGREYSLLFVPPAELQISDSADAFFFASLDLLSFEDRFAPAASFRLDALSVAPIAASNITVAETLLHDDLAQGTAGWEFGGAAPFTLALSGAEAGALSLSRTDDFTFGYWTRDTGVVVKPGAVYRGRFFVHTNIDDPAGVPTFRLRLNTSSHQLGATVNVDPVGPRAETLRTEPRAYDVYLRIPAGDPGADTILASIDLLGFDDTSDPQALVVLEQFFLEQVELGD